MATLSDLENTPLTAIESITWNGMRETGIVGLHLAALELE